MTKKVLVTGGAGYIGSHTVVELLDAGYEVVIVDNFSNSHVEVINRIQMITGKYPTLYQLDLLEKQLLRDVFLEHEIDGVIHFAGLKAVGESVKLPLMYYKENILSTINLCELMTEFNVKKLIFSSSATVYDSANKMPVNEKANLNASNPYGRTKLFIEDILRDLYISDAEWKITLLRYFNPVGAHKSGLIGESPNGIPNNLMPYITNVASGKLDKLQVFGSDYNTPDGTGVRDFIHVVDLAIGHLRAYEKKNTPGVSTFNMGTGQGHSVLEIIEAFEKATGINIPYEIVDRRPGDIPVSFADVSKAKHELNWKAERDVIEMCYDAWNWQEKNPDGLTVGRLKQNVLN